MLWLLGLLLLKSFFPIFKKKIRLHVGGQRKVTTRRITNVMKTSILSRTLEKLRRVRDHSFRMYLKRLIRKQTQSIKQLNRVDDAYIDRVVLTSID